MAEKAWAPFHIPQPEVLPHIDPGCLANCSCPNCDKVFHGRLFFFTHWSLMRHEADILVSMYQDRIGARLGCRILSIFRNRHISIWGKREEFRDKFADIKVYVYSSLILLPRNVKWRQPWEKVLMSTNHNRKEPFRFDRTERFQEWAAISACPPHREVEFYRAAKYQLLTSSSSMAMQYGDGMEFCKHISLAFPDLKFFWDVIQETEDAKDGVRKWLHPEWTPGSKKYSELSLKPFTPVQHKS
ncbi:hypothetical protein FOXG_21373 [Fusarium oxysporum f. sp. lycopersici 4287]|uniref:Uncharacterized protein n=1 Tax=Fusarium oxysporum f. sp. lycopersici (strain 4287 / CBS 123668 / FGSC 9935 / NRRL 34936) TaxID=426428 RepID=A0A0J9VS48_FUSO4|nr:hypothetical protein FOXG_20932 [Fusarium oxysporum f. sp. lycopersici 4287]XP_018253590.1 hypothetical protein FOXG_21373 [Fusarium oxysporum f. sp. lycopersici 4287]KAJ9413049.1 hypothetical protein QL093DRAFT_2527272 [Fusarium oxysporum]KNB13809.1 hypothetical protein FOXG_20932 [Fusarium oxysporum f. sp. lycopersici 4287]KNB15545.1 hypothetical protein FOXG_21373 [Fusarium oxysporum f. sp. lycopersici 4287]